jgi:peptidoglycan/xylan/chitin deacetylase (PgdA/CDA1 family)
MMKMRGRVLLYHQISEAPSKTAAKTTLFVHPQHFATQVFLLKRFFKVVSLEELLWELKKGVITPRSVAVTFDDATVDFGERAVPILERYRVPVTLFVVAGKMGEKTDWVDRDGIPQACLLDAEALRELPSFVDIGSHSLTHPRFNTLVGEQLAREIFDSKALLERKLRRPVRWFAYPFGEAPEEAKTMVRKAGYLMALSSRRGWIMPASDLWALPRLAVPYWVGRVGFLLWLRLAPEWGRRKT